MRVPLDYQTSASLIQEKKYLVQRGETRSLKLKLAFAATKLSRQTNHRLLLFSFFKQYAVRNRWVGGKIRLTLFLYCPTSSFPSCINAPVGARTPFRQNKRSCFANKCQFLFSLSSRKTGILFFNLTSQLKTSLVPFLFFFFSNVFTQSPPRRWRRASAVWWPRRRQTWTCYVTYCTQLITRRWSKAAQENIEPGQRQSTIVFSSNSDRWMGRSNTKWPKERTSGVLEARMGRGRNSISFVLLLLTVTSA